MQLGKMVVSPHLIFKHHLHPRLLLDLVSRQCVPYPQLGPDLQELGNYFHIFIMIMSLQPPEFYTFLIRFSSYIILRYSNYLNPKKEAYIFAQYQLLESIISLVSSQFNLEGILQNIFEVLDLLYHLIKLHLAISSFSPFFHFEYFAQQSFLPSFICFFGP